MGKQNFYSLIAKELQRVDASQTAKREERIITGFTKDPSPRAVINKKQYLIFNSNDYLGLRFDEGLKQAEHQASETYGTGPGSVRFISGTLQVYRDLEKAIAKFHKREDAMVFSSAFATNIAVISCLIKGQSKDSLVDTNTLVISDELNHRSIIEGIRVANLPKEQRLIYKHLDFSDLAHVLEEHKKNYKRVLILTDGIFSMLGEAADFSVLNDAVKKYDGAYDEGIMTVADDSHGVGIFGTTGRGCEETSKSLVDVLVGTFGKAFGSDGGYVVGDKEIIAYLRESAATYIYSNSVSPGVAGAALQAIQTIDSPKGKKLLQVSRDNIALFKKMMKQEGFIFAADSMHPIQPILIADAYKTKRLTDELFKSGILATNINYPVVPKGKDEVRVQISASHTKEDIEYFVASCTQAGKKIGVL